MSSYIQKKRSEFINQGCIKMIKGEAAGLMFLLICECILISALFKSDRNVFSILYFEISLYYVFPIIVVTCGVIYLFYRFLKIYKNIVFDYL